MRQYIHDLAAAFHDRFHVPTSCAEPLEHCSSRSVVCRRFAR